MTKAALFAIALLTAIPVTRAFAGQPLGVVYFTEWSALLDPPAAAAIKLQNDGIPPTGSSARTRARRRISAAGTRAGGY